MDSRLVTMLVVMLAAAAYGSPAAAFGACEDPAYWRSFDERLVADSFGCTERARFTLSTEDGPRIIRVIQGFNADWAIEPGYPEAVENGVRAAANALGRIGAYRVDDITVLLVDDLPPVVDALGHKYDVLGMASDREDRECRIAMYALAGEALSEVPVTIAHEIFHCVQYRTARRERVFTLTGVENPGGDWWVEGSAEWFSLFAVDSPEVADQRMAEFDMASESRPLHHMAYEALPLFLWLVETRGPAAVPPFLRAMATSAGAAAQEAAMRGALSTEEWRRFAQAYLDREIRDARGRTVPSSPADGNTWRFSAPRTERIPLRPFVLARGTLAFDCGRWGVAASGLPSAALAARAFTGPWGPIPGEIDGRNPEEAAYILAAMNTESRNATLTLDVTVRSTCEPCAGTEEIDSCLVGSWRKTGGGAVEWMRRELPPEFSITHQDSDGIVTYRADGSYWSAPYGYGMTGLHRKSMGVTRAEGGAVAQGFGRWSVTGGVLNQCPHSESLAGTLQVTRPEHSTRTARLSPPRASGPVRMSYRCTETILETQLPIPGSASPIITTFTRIDSSDAPADEARD